MKQVKLLNRNRITLVLLASFTLLTYHSFAQPFLEKRIPVYVYAGATFADMTTKAIFEEKIPGINSELSLENDLNFPTRTVFPFFRIIPGGRLQVSGGFASLHRKGEDDLTREFLFGDSVYSVGSRIKGYLNTDYFSLRLEYSIFHSLKFNAGLSLGLGYSMFKAGVDAYSYGLSFKRDVSLNVPVILPGAHINIYLLPNTLFRTSVNFLSIKINDSNGKIASAQISLEQYLLKFLGAGIGYSYNSFQARNLPENAAYLKNIDFVAKGFSFFAALRF